MNHRIKIIAIFFLLACIAFALSANAHHILGVPHYAYDEAYPQTPTLTYRIEAGPNEVRMTGYPGIPKPGERCSLHVYISNRDNGTPFKDPVTLTVMQDSFFGDDPIIYGPSTAHLEEAMFKFNPIFKEEANYIIRVQYQAEGAPWIIDLPMAVGEPGNPWTVLGTLAAALTTFLIIIRAIHIKQKRRAKRKTTTPQPIENPVTS
jgi:hypothetical protein